MSSSISSTSLSDDFGNLSTTDEEMLVWVAIVFSFVSAVSSLFIIVTFWRFPRLHRFAYKIIVALAVSNLGLDVAYLMGEVGTDNWKCTIQGFGRVYFALVGFALVTAVTMTCYVMIVRRNFSIQERFWTVMAYCWLVPLVMSCLPFTTDNYGDGGAWCSITSRSIDALVWGTFWRFAVIYVPLWVCVIWNGYMCVTVFRAMRGFEATMVAYAEPGVGGDAEGCSATEREGGGSGTEAGRGAPRRSASGLEISTSIPIIKRLRLYPLVLVICWSWATINRVHEAFDPAGTTVFWLFMLQYAFQTIQGVLNLAIFLQTPGVLEEWRDAMTARTCWPFQRSAASVDTSALLGTRNSRNSSSSSGSVAAVVQT